MRLERISPLLVLLAILIMSLSCTPSVTKSPPVAQISITSTTVTADESISISGAGSTDDDGDITSYEWDFGDGSTAYGAIVSHAYPVPGTYNIELTVIDNDGLKDTEVVMVTCVKPELGPVTYHVATTGNDVTGDGSEDNPWATINHAIGQAASGDTIIVHDGTYTENVDVNKSLTIQSMNGATVTVVQAANIDDHVFEVTVDHVIIRGFAVRNARNATGIRLYHSSDNTIESNTCSNSGTGISLSDNSNGNTIKGNTCSDNDYDGISAHDSSDNTIESNACSNNGSGIVINSCSSTTIKGNTCSNNDYNGTHLYDSSDNTIENNTFSGSGSGICLNEHSDTNIIEGNTLSDNRSNAIYVYDSSNNIIKNNTCSGPGINICLLGTSSGNIIESNSGCSIWKP
jgi:parallel beta-helix repeat protein